MYVLCRWDKSCCCPESEVYLLCERERLLTVNLVLNFWCVSPILTLWIDFQSQSSGIVREQWLGGNYQPGSPTDSKVQKVGLKNLTRVLEYWTTSRLGISSCCLLLELSWWLLLARFGNFLSARSSSNDSPRPTTHLVKMMYWMVISYSENLLWLGRLSLFFIFW